MTTSDPYLPRVRHACLSLPGAAEKVSHGRPHFFTKKVFAIYGAVTKGDPRRYDQSLLVLPDQAEATALLTDARFFVPAYWGPSGWVGLDFTAAPVDWVEVGELIEESFRRTASAALIRALPGA